MMSVIFCLLQAAPGLDSMTSLGAAGLMGAMWLWERSTSQKRESQIDEAHARIMADRVQLDQLMSVVKQNTEVMSKLCVMQEQMVGRMGDKVTR
jgi:hypothetical protein